MKRNYEYLLSDLSLLKGRGIKTSNLLGFANPSLERNTDSTSFRTPNAAPSIKLGKPAIRSYS